MSAQDFKRGAESTAYAHYAFMRKQGEATAELGKRLIKKIDQHGNLIDVIIDELNFQEMQRVFGIHKSLDIIVLGESDKIKLLSYLAALTVQKGQHTSLQNQYFSAVKRYLNVSGFDYGMDLKSVSELDIQKSELKAFFECVCEFLFLKTGTCSFLSELYPEIECFGFNTKVIEEIVFSIEQTYKYFGVQGIIDHYDVVPPKREEEKQEPLKIPFFEKAFAIIYNGKEKYHGEYAEMLKAAIEERSEALGVDKPQVRIEDENKLEISFRSLEETRHLIYIDIPKQAKDLVAVMKWHFSAFGMKYGTLGEKSIITVKELKKKQYKEFLDYAKDQQLRQISDIEKNLRSQEETILKTAFDKNEPLAVNIMVGILGSWLILPSALIDWSNAVDDREKLKRLQYSIAIDKFIESKITPYI